VQAAVVYLRAGFALTARSKITTVRRAIVAAGSLLRSFFWLSPCSSDHIPRLFGQLLIEMEAGFDAFLE
jgi:hypothetical protein